MKDLENDGFIELPGTSEFSTNNAHMFYLKCRTLEIRTALIAYLKTHNIMAVFHYVPLHSAPAGLEFGVFHGIDRVTTNHSERLVRLPLFYGLEKKQVKLITTAIKSFYIGIN